MGHSHCHHGEQSLKIIINKYKTNSTIKHILYENTIIENAHINWNKGNDQEPFLDIIMFTVDFKDHIKKEKEKAKQENI